MNRHTPQYNPFVIDCKCINEHYNLIPAGYEFFLRTVRFYEIQFITRGAGKLIIEGQHYEPRRGELFFLKPGLKVEGVSGFFSYIVCFDPVFSESRQHCYHSNIPFWASNEPTMLPDGGYFDDLPLKYNTARFNELEPLFFNIFQAFWDDRQTNQLRMNAVILQIMNIIYEEMDDNPSILLEKLAINQYFERVMACKQYIDKHPGNKFSLETLALQFGSSSSFFSRIFKKVLGITPFEYIIESRLTLARKLLTTTGESVEQVASTCGFDDISYFYRLFKRHFKMTPALLYEGYRNRAQMREDTVNDEGKAWDNPSVQKNFVIEDHPAEVLTDHEPNPLSINPYIIGYSCNNQPDNLYPVGVKTVPRVARFYEIELIIGGSGKKITDSRHFKVARSDIFFRKPGMVNQDVSGYYFYEIAFDPVYSESRRYCYESPVAYYLTDQQTILPNQEFFYHFPYKYHTAKLSEFEPLFANIIQSFPKYREDQQLETRANLLKLLTMVNEELNTYRPVFFENQMIKNNYEKVMICKKLIDDHPDHKFSLETLADLSGLSRNFFCKIFKQIIGNSPLEYIRESRIRLAKNLLATSSMSIEEISSRCGFDNVTYFYRIFKCHMNMTPNTFRQKLAVSQSKLTVTSRTAPK